MRNYLLAVAFTALLAAVYSVQNAGYVTVRFLFWTRDVPQGIWEAAIFAAGCVVMWLLSLFGSMEMRDRCMEKVSDLEARIGKLEKNCSLQEESGIPQERLLLRRRAVAFQCDPRRMRMLLQKRINETGRNSKSDCPVQSRTSPDRSAVFLDKEPCGEDGVFTGNCRSS
ncbi:LapA family protein [Aminivibrio sp.]|uniref:LapA family protein n=1 Tax=Aminivibrio sp. TaxID=1872489 RepID=UPI003D9559BD